MSQDIDILSQLDNIDLSSVATAAPLLPSGLYEMTVAEMAVVQQRAPKTGNNIKLKLTLANPAVDIDGKPVNPGFPVFDQISLTKTYKEDGSVSYDPMPRLAVFREAVLGDKSGSFGGPAEWASTYIGKTVMVKIAYDPDSKDKAGKSWGPQSRVDRYVKKK